MFDIINFYELISYKNKLFTTFFKVKNYFYFVRGKFLVFSSCFANFFMLDIVISEIYILYINLFNKN